MSQTCSTDEREKHNEFNIIHLLTEDESNIRYVRLDERNAA